MKRVLLVGAFPPPVHGASSVNAFMRGKLLDPIVIDLSPRTLGRGAGAKTLKALLALVGLGRMAIRLRSIGSVYIGLSGGSGLFFDFAFAALAHIARKRLVLHHHSYAYLAAPSLAMRLITRVCADAHHIVACCRMADALSSMYGAQHIITMSAAVALETPKTVPSPRTSVKVLGFLSNIEPAKGIYEVIDVLRRVSALGIQTSIAGPVADPAILGLLRNLGHVYRGPLYGEDKYAFLDEIDVFLFPTKYVHETEGLVIHEAMSRGAPVIASDRGCIGGIVREGGATFRGHDFVTSAVALIKRWHDSPDELKQASENAISDHAEVMAEATAALSGVLALLTESPPPRETTRFRRTPPHTTARPREP